MKIEKIEYESTDSKKNPLTINNINKITIDIILREENPDQLLALYLFYAYVSTWQDTIQIKATTGFTAEGLKWSTKKVQRVKKRLLKLQLIEDVVKRDDNKKVKGYYIKVNYLVIKHSNCQSKTSSQTPQIGRGGVLGGQMLNTSNINAMSITSNTHGGGKPRRMKDDNLLLTDKDSSFSERYGMKIQNKLNLHSKYKPVSSKTWAKQINYLLQKMNIDKDTFKEIINWYITKGTDYQYSPKIYKPEHLVEKWNQLQDAMIKYTTDQSESHTNYRKGPDGEYGYYEDED